MPCLCGAEDCPRCYPGNFYKGVYLDGDVTEEQIDDDIEDRAVAEYLDRQVRDALACESGRYDP